ncbi:aminotransferase class I/II-fold pyridoxal phosphate-dependent enzyme [Pelagicoccus sp. SDUM812002]|uniref:aminotransferase class I/II-fold pyridoxal phosphate-dependent enzyme n=1 Tax=Pelagicoccus sp. SDUM812002 TaxID=3041266 RepID=UPI00280C73E6|nr:aminotransferase class I/II-fold pyridoxal phosphate-dependent enzyme [Pelagicoccus sp. SDUM812002]MDQ8186172.1 aminotransferase class I/II-fold pyridoxal phosphate-dependent enzyme [Pelagicoccus sp. SDUM812002]
MEIDPYPSVIPYGRQWIDESDIAAVVETLRSDFVAQGPQVAALETALCELTGTRYAVAVSSGTAALHLSCLGLGIGPADRGIVPAITFAATANCLKYSGANVTFCDVDSSSGLATSVHFMDALEKNPVAKVLLPVSYSGSVSDLSEISNLANEAGAFVIEDAAHSIGATYGSGSRSASCEHSDAAILSFHPVKHICAGEGGAVLTNDETLARRLRTLRTHGIEPREQWRYDQVELGYHYRMTDLQASLALSQLKRLPDFLTRRRALVSRYRRAFEEEPFCSRIRVATTDEQSAHHLFVVHFRDEVEREAAYTFFHRHNVRVQIHYMPVYRHSYYEGFESRLCKGADRFYATCLSLPLYPLLKDEEQNFVIRCLRAFLDR